MGLPSRGLNPSLPSCAPSPWGSPHHMPNSGTRKEPAFSKKNVPGAWSRALSRMRGSPPHCRGSRPEDHRRGRSTRPSTMDEKFPPRTNDLEGKKELLDIMINKESHDAHGGGDMVRINGSSSSGINSKCRLDGERVHRKDVRQEAKDYFDKMHNEYTLSHIVANEDEALAAFRRRHLRNWRRNTR